VTPNARSATAGEYEESGNTQNTCIPVPANCTIEDCGCTPADTRCVGDALLTCNVDGTAEVESACPFGCAEGACLCEPGAARCDGDMRISCDADGRGETAETCVMGCSGSTSRCMTFEPSFGVGQALTLLTPAGDIEPPTGTRFFPDGSVLDPLGNAIAVQSVSISQADGPNIRVFVARSFVLDSASFFSHVALVATDRISLIGANTVLATNAPHAGCNPQGAMRTGGGGSRGAGGGGNGTAGGNGGGFAPQPLGGQAITANAMVAGCPGGNITGTPAAFGGMGGGAVQLVSFTEILINGTLSAPGNGGGVDGGGGGAGGSITMEAPVVRVDGAVAATGGGGGGCTAGSPGGEVSGGPGAYCASPTFPFRDPLAGGDGAAGLVAGGNAEVCTNDCGPSSTRYGGGGGGAGSATIRTLSGNALGSAEYRLVVTAAELVPIEQK